MSFNRGAVLALMVSVSFMALSASCYGGVVYKVGDSAGWSSVASFDYKTWSSAKTFRVGDTIVFEYDKQKHNVIELRHREYHSCHTTSPEATYSSGNDSITIKFPGHYYYTCGFVGHCQAGLKVDIRVLPTSQSPGESPQTPSAPSPPNPFFESPPPLSPSVETPPSPTLPSPPNPFFDSPPPPSPTLPSPPKIFFESSPPPPPPTPSTSVETPPSPTLPSPPNPIFHLFDSPPPPAPLQPSEPSPPQKRGATASSTGSTLTFSLGSLIGLLALEFWVAYYFGY